MKILNKIYFMVIYGCFRGMNMHLENLFLEVTRNCTLECEHCLRGDRQRVNMDNSVLESVFKDVKKVDRLLLTGG